MTGLLALLFLVSLLYATAPLYQFAESRPFAGGRWYNPYGDLNATGRWQKASLHAHSVAWGGATHGGQSAEQVAAAYAQMRYDIVGLSNYHSMSAAEQTGTFPVYEQGWNLQKSHRLAIGGDAVVWRDYPLGQTVHHKQDIINRLELTGAVVVLAHPAIREGHSVADLRQLSGYDALEVLNHFVSPATTEWDAALSSGRAVWVMASDDSHDIHGAGETGVNWTLVYTHSRETHAVRSAIRSGRTIGVHGVGGQAQLSFVSQQLFGDTLEVRARGPIAHIEFTGQDGATRTAHVTDSLGVTIARAVARPDDGYLRATVIGTGSDAPELLLLNPVVRWDGVILGAAAATVDAPRTAAFRWIACCLYAAVFTSVQARRRRRLPKAQPVPA
ncbi:hypothetical protein GEMMAAP_00375 [Gemmatimonas phototrophica]|uniref:Polymerase/histidinol phosphatase N-terminal domain-containing protein n=1 Tax=Gemmatimonas phototrophica TaxID=1379270 RepID=A0A143BGH2_9BACT|nr:hypothetical protein GEMMAAP_00375 [Gemmatimonas phototrophica]